MQSLSRLCSDSNLHHRGMRGNRYDLCWIQRVVVRPIYYLILVVAAHDKKQNPRSSSENLEWRSLEILAIKLRLIVAVANIGSIWSDECGELLLI
jgi:hypothetical protein